MQPASTDTTGDTGRQDAAAPVSKWTQLLWAILLPILLPVLFVIAIHGCEQAHRDARKRSCCHNLRIIGLSIRNHKCTYGTLPPAQLIDSAGKPTHSWRTLISPYIYYDLETDYFSLLDFSKPWDDPVNTSILDRYVGTIQCPEREDDPPTKRTPYVAVVGEGTAWPPPITGDQLPEPLPDDQRAANFKASEQTKHEPAKILVVEWPESDIQWTEPRDLSVDEFLAWFEAQRGKTTIHPGDSILYLGDDFEAHELPLSTSIAQVRALLMADTTDAADVEKD